MNGYSLERSLTALRRAALLAIIRREGRSIPDSRIDDALMKRKFSESIELIRPDTLWYVAGWHAVRSWLSWPQSR